MTKNLLLIQSVALGLLLSFSSPAKANVVDQVLVQYFNKLYLSASPKCTVDPATKSRILAQIESKCLVRTVTDNGSFISGTKPECSEASVKTSVDAQVNALCENTALKADQAAQLKYQEQQAATQQQAAARTKNAKASARALRDTVKLVKGFAKLSPKKEPVPLLPDGTRAVKINEIPNLTSGGALNKASEAANIKIREHNAAVDKLNASSAKDAKAAATSPVATKYETSDEGHIIAQTEPDGRVTITKYDKYGTEQSRTANSAGDADAKITALGGDPKHPIYPTDPETKKSVSKLPAEAKPAGEKATDGNGSTGTDAALEARKAKADSEDKALNSEIAAMEEQLKTASAASLAEAQERCNGIASEVVRNECLNGEPQKAITCLETNLAKIIADKEKLKEQKESCSNSSSQAEKLCSMLRNDKALQVQQLMSVGATLLSKVTAASEACETTSNLSKAAQGGMLIAQGACTAMKFRCDYSCKAAQDTIAEMKTSAEAIQKCNLTLESIASSGTQAQKSAAQLFAKLDLELKPEQSVPAAVTQCENHKLDIITLGLSAAGFLSAHADAVDCKEQLASGANNNSKSTSALAGPQITTAEYCSMPGNSSSLTCKCTNNPNAEGCMGSLAKSGVSAGKVNSGNGASAFASAGYNGLGSLNPSRTTPSGSEAVPAGANLSEAAREALGIGSDGVNSSGDPVMASGLSSRPSGSDVSASNQNDVAKEKPRFGFFSSIGNMISGGKKPAQAATATIRKFEQEQAIKRKIASDQVRAEISRASGKSNFDKIRSRYQQNAASFEQ